MYELIKNLPDWVQWVLLLVPIFSLLIAACALLKNVKEISFNNRIRRAKFVFDFLQTFMNDDTMQSAFRTIDYGEFKYNPDFHNRPGEAEIDKLLLHFSNLASALERGVVNSTDIYPVQYFILRIVKNPEIKKYLDFMENIWGSASGTGTHPFISLDEMAKKVAESAMAANSSNPLFH